MRVAARAHGATGASGDGLEPSGRIHVGNGCQFVAIASDQLVDGRHDHPVFRHHLHCASGSRVGDPHLLLGRSQNGHGFGHEVHGGLNDDGLGRITLRLQGQHITVRHHAAVSLYEFDNFTAHVEVGQQQQGVAKVVAGRLHVSVEPSKNRFG